MKKNHIATAVLLASCSLAQAQSSLTLYGNIDAYIESIRATGQATQTKVSSGGLAPTKWGMRGTEDLGGGLKATFKLESSTVNADDGSSAGGFNRAAHVGLSSATFGDIVLGRQNAPMNDAIVWTDTDWGSNFSPNTALLLNNDIAGKGTGGIYHLRQSNLISYNTPKFKGFDAKVAFGPGEGAALNAAGTVKARNTLGGSLRYSEGPMLATAAFHHGSQDTAAGVNKQDAYNLAVRYDFGIATLSGDYYKNRNKLANGAEPKLTGAVVGVLVPKGAWAFVAQYGHVTDNGLNIAGIDKGKGKSDLFNVGAHYYFSKRTIAYVRVARAKDDGNGFNGQAANAAIGFGGAMPANGSAQTVALGIYHGF